MKLVILESPYKGEVDKNTAYARQCMRDCLERGEAPYASHLLYTQPRVLDDNDPDERALGIEAGLAWGDQADATIVYVDRGISQGMKKGIRRAYDHGRLVKFRSIEGMTPTEILIAVERAGIAGVEARVRSRDTDDALAFAFSVGRE